MNAEDAPYAVAVAQFAPSADTAANLEEISRLAVDAASRGAMLVVFPEYSSYFTPTMGADWVEAAQTLERRRAGLAGEHALGGRAGSNRRTFGGW